MVDRLAINLRERQRQKSPWRSLQPNTANALPSPQLSGQCLRMFEIARISPVRRLTNRLLAPLCLSLSLAASPALAHTQDTPPASDPFSILAPVVETPESTQSAIPDLPAAGHLSRDAYLARTAGRNQDVIRTQWQIQRTSLDGMRLSSDDRIVVLGDGYVLTSESDQISIHDFTTNRILNSVGSLDGLVMRNTSMTARVHRKMDTFTTYTQGGTLDRIPGPGGSSFDRFWIEAAMGVRMNSVSMLTTTATDGAREAKRNALEAAAFSYLPDTAGTAASADLLLRWMRHALPIHPDALDIMLDADGIPSRFSFLVFSPSSPAGRREIWTRTSLQTEQADYPWPADIETAPAESYEMRDTQYLPLIQAGLRAAATPDEAPDGQDFIEIADAANNRADRAGAYLTLFQASNHFGACASADASAVCQRIGRSAALGADDPQFEAILATLTAMGNNRAAALDGLQQHLARETFAGATANLLAAQALATVQTSGGGAEYNTNPIRLFAQSARLDPYAPLTYWHAGRYAVSQGDIEMAWLLFDIARSLPTASLLTPLSEAQAMTGQLRTIAPNFFAP
jgi:hypothetical protein